MRGIVSRIVAIGLLALVPGAASAQVNATITGVVKDSSGAVLPGVTVEASSPALIDKVRSAVTDSNGQYRIATLPPGMYTVRFGLSGFSTVVQEGVVLTTGFTATLSPELRVGALQETITVSGETPVVDVESARQLRVMEADALKELPSGRSPSQILSMIPGMSGGSGICTGGTCGPTLNGFSAHGGNNAEGRLQVDGMSAGAAIGGAGVSGYLVDVANAQEIMVSLSGGLGEAEVGGPVINVIPRSGGNTLSGSYFTSYTRQAWWDKNNDTHSNINVVNSREYDADFNGSIGGPIKRDQLWYFLVGRNQTAKSNTPNGFRNLNEGVFGANYAPDRSQPTQAVNTSRNAALRLTWQASPRNRFTVYWDEQFWCTNCERGSASAGTSPEATTTAAVGTPNRVQQFTWTNPWTSRILLEGRLSTLNQKWGIWPSFEETFYRDIPRIAETGTGAYNGSITSGASTDWDDDSGNTNASLAASYITGSHNLKVGYQGGFINDWSRMDVNNLRLHYTYQGTAATGIPVPSQITMWARPRALDERTRYAALFVQDQWTVQRVTVQGALRYDHAWSYFPEQSTGPDRFIPVAYGFPKTDGVSFSDVNARWSATWDMFGTGKTALKYQMGRYLQPANVGGVFNATNPMRRSPESLVRGWQDLNNNRVVDCDLFNYADHTVSGGDRCLAAPSGSQFGVDPRLTGVGFTTTHCGRTDEGIPQPVLDYCNAADQDLISGWGKREYDWQFALGVQHEILPRVSAEVTYNRRWYGNFYTTDNINLGCNLNDACLAANANGTNPDYDFLSITAPSDPRLPDGGGYVISGLTDIKPGAVSRTTLNAITQTSDRQSRYWHGIDTNVTLRPRGGLRLQAGTSTGRQVQDSCRNLVNDPQDLTIGDRRNCHSVAPYQTNFRGTASYVVPKVDVLVSSVYQYRPGPELSANYTVTCSAAAGCGAITWAPGSTPGRGQTVFLSTLTTKTVNLIPSNTMFGEGHTEIDLKVAKIFRFAGTRANVGVDIYNLLNTDAITSYNQTFTPTAANAWLTPTNLVQPRFARVQVQLDF
jgi:hypothetical protein